MANRGQRNNQLPPIKIGVWGLPATGKSMFFVVFACGHNTPIRQWTISPDPATQTMITDSEHRILAQNDRMTVKTREAATYSIEVQGTDILRTDVRGSITWNDVAGENVIQSMNALTGDLLACDAILCFIDSKPEQTPTDNANAAAGHAPVDVIAQQKSAFRQLFQRLLPRGINRDRKIAQILAIIVTKIDSNPAYWDLRGEPRKLLGTVLGDPDIMDHIATYCHPNRYDVFTCSTVGVIQEEGTSNLVSNTKKFTKTDGEVVDVIKDIVHWHPVGIGEPIKYIMTSHRNRN